MLSTVVALLIAAVAALSPVNAETTNACGVALRAGQEAALAQARARGFQTRAFVRTSAGRSQHVVLLEEPAPHAALNSDAGQRLYAEFDRIAFDFDFARKRWWQELSSLPERFLVALRIKTPAGLAPETASDLAHNPYVRRFGNRSILNFHDDLPEFIRRSYTWRFESGELLERNKLFDTRPRWSTRFFNLTRALDLAAVALLGTASLTSSSPLRWASVLGAGALLAYQVLAQHCTDRALFPLHHLARSAGMNHRVRELDQVFESADAVLLLVPVNRGAHAAQALRRAGFDELIQTATEPRADSALETLPPELRVNADLLAHARDVEGGAELIAGLAQIFAVIEPASLGALARATVNAPAVDTEDVREARANPYLATKPDVGETETQNLLSARQIYGDVLDPYALGVLSTLLYRARPSVPTTEGAPTSATPVQRRHRTKQLLAHGFYREATIDLLRKVTPDADEPRQFAREAAARALAANRIDQKTLETLDEFFRSIAVAQHKEPACDLRERYRLRAPLTVLTVLLGTWLHGAPPPLAPYKLEQRLLNQAQELLAPLKISKPRASTVTGETSAPSTAFEPVDFFAPNKAVAQPRGMRRPKIVEPAPRELVPRPEPIAPDKDLRALVENGEQPKPHVVYEFVFEREPEEGRQRVIFGPATIKWLDKNSVWATRVLSALMAGHSSETENGLKRFKHLRSRRYDGDLWEVRMAGKFRPLALQENGVWQIPLVADKGNYERLAETLVPVDAKDQP